MVRYYGLYANAHRGKIKKAGVLPSHPPIIEEEERFVPSKGWAEMIKKVYEIDPLTCPKCGGKMRMSKTLPGLENFYMVGQWVSPGGGLPSGVITGNHVVQIICKRDKKPFITTVP